MSAASDLELNLNSQIVGIPMRTKYAPLVTHLYLFCYEREFTHKKNRLTVLMLSILLLDTFIDNIQMVDIVGLQ